MKIRNKIAAGLMGITMLSGLGVATAGSASAAEPRITPVCYYKKVVVADGGLLGNQVTVFNVVNWQEQLQFPARTKRCFITQTKEVKSKITGSVTRSTIWFGTITVRY